MTTCTLPDDLPLRASRLAWGASALMLGLGAAAAVLGIQQEAVSLWGFGAACLLQVPLGVVAGRRTREGLGNRGLEGELRATRLTFHLLRLLALGLLLAAGADLLANRGSAPSLPGLVLGALGALGFLALGWAQRGFADHHPTLAQAAQRTRLVAEAAALLALGSLAGRWLPWADAACALLLAGRIIFVVQALAKPLALKPTSCGGCSCG